MNESLTRQQEESKIMAEGQHFWKDGWDSGRRSELLRDELRPGEVRRGVVSNLTDFGAFVDLGVVKGLIPMNQLAWSGVHHPGELLHVGQAIDVQVLSVDKDKKEVTLAMKRAEEDPWRTAGQRYTAGQMVIGTVTKVAPFGAFAHIADGIEGLLHRSELLPGTDPQSVLYEGAELELRIRYIDIQRRRLHFSLRPPEAEDETHSS